MTQAWRIHLGWAIVTIVAALVSFQVASRRGEKAPRGAHKPLQAIPGKPVSPTGERTRAEAFLAGNQEPSSTPGLPPSTDSTVDRIRALLRRPLEWEELESLVEGFPDRPLKLSLLKEALYSKKLESFYAAVNLLGRMKGRDVAEILESYLASHRDEQQAAHAATNLGEIGDSGSMSVLIESLQSKEPEVRLWSAEALMKMGFSAPAEELIADMSRQYESPDGAIRKKAIDTLSQLCFPRTVPILSRALKDSNGDVRISAVQAFANLRKPEYIPLLESLLGDPNPDVARTIQDTIEYLKNP